MERQRGAGGESEYPCLGNGIMQENDGKPKAHRKIGRNTFFSFLGQIIQAGTNMAVFIILARAINDANRFGKLTFAMSLTGLFIGLSNLGMYRLVTKEVARNKASSGKIVGSANLIQMCASVVTLVALGIIAKASGFERQVELLVYILGVSVVLITFAGILGSVFVGIQRVEFQTIMVAASSAVALVSTVIVCVAGWSLVAAAGIFLVSRTTSLIVAGIIYRTKVARIFLSFKFSDGMNLLIRAMPFAILSLFGLICYHLDTVLLRYIRGDTSVGYYQPAAKIFLSLLMLPPILDTGFFPVLSKLRQDVKSFVSVGRHYNMTLLLISIGAATLLFVEAERIVLAVFGPEYIKSAPALRLLSIALIMRFSLVAHQNVLIAFDKQKFVALAMTLGGVVAIVSNIMLVRKFDYIGTCYAMIVVHGFMAALIVTKSILAIKSALIGGRIVLVLACALGLGYCLNSAKNLSVFLTAPAFLAVYCLITYLILGKTDKAFILRAVMFWRRPDMIAPAGAKQISDVNGWS